MKDKPTVKEEVTYTVEVWRCSRERYTTTFRTKAKARTYIRRQNEQAAKTTRYEEGKYQMWNEEPKLLVNRTRTETAATEL